MSVTVYLMKSTDDRKKISKNPTTICSVSATMKENTSLFQPTMLISKSALGKNWAGANYAYIPDFGNRYYFIDNITAETGQALAFSMTVDPLKTYQSDLLYTPFEVARSEDINSPYFVDTEKALINRKVVETLPIGHITQSQTGNKYTITVAGGA